MKITIRITHGLYHYLLGLGLFLAPWFIAASTSAVIIHSVTGAFLLASSAFAAYELGWFRLLKYKEYLYATLLAAALLIGLSLSRSLAEPANMALLSGGVLSAFGSVFSLRAHHVNRHKVQLHHG
jgi:hypothetical protein